MGTLYIVGNGLDLHFNLKTKPKHFIECLRSQSVYNELDNALDVLIRYDVNWGYYEQSLKDINLNEIASQNEIYPDYLSEHESDRDGGILNMQLYVDSLSHAINSALEEMTNAANNEITKFSLFTPKKELFQNGDAILTFNYTSTIEYLFSIPNNVPIFHIHGYYEQRTPLIFGYGNKGNIYNDAWVSIDKENRDYYISKQREVVYAFYESWRKKLQIEKLNIFLSRCYGVDKIVVLGHSMSAVDSEYMEYIERVLRPVNWEISYYNMYDIERIQLQNYSFQNKIKFAKLEELLKE